MDGSRNTWGAKLKRTATSALPVHKNRKGSCIDCGACCRLPTKCIFLGYKRDGKSYCMVHPIRPLNCRKYPRTKSEWITEDTCGYSFD